MADPSLKERRCPHCGRLLCKVEGTDARVELKCKCGRVVTVAIVAA